MTKVSKKILNRASGKVNQVPGVMLEKSAVSPEGTHAQVLFRFSTPDSRAKGIAKQAELVEASFASSLGDNARFIGSTIAAAGRDGLFSGFVKLNRPTLDLDEANKSDSGFHLVSANVYADESDMIWNVEEDESGARHLVRNCPEDLAGLLKARGHHLSTAAAGMPLSASYKAGQYVRFFDQKAERYRNGIAVDTATVIDYTKGAVHEVAGMDVIAYCDTAKQVSTELAKVSGSDTKTFKELAAADRRAVIEYLTKLYSVNPNFLRAYMTAIDGNLAI